MAHAHGPEVGRPRLAHVRTRIGVRGDAGFSMIELLVVMVIIAILLAIVVPTFLSPKRDARARAVRSAAMSYEQAIKAFSQDHAGRVPCAGTCPRVDWSSRMDYGPVEPLPDASGQPRRYMREGVPEAISGELADFQIAPIAAGATLPATGRAGVIVYVRDGADPTRYRLEVWIDDGTGRAKADCYFGNMTPPSPWKQC